MDLEHWTDLDLTYLLAFGTHPDLPPPAATRGGAGPFRVTYAASPRKT